METTQTPTRCLAPPLPLVSRLSPSLQSPQSCREPSPRHPARCRSASSEPYFARSRRCNSAPRTAHDVGGHLQSLCAAVSRFHHLSGKWLSRRARLVPSPALGLLRHALVHLQPGYFAVPLERHSVAHRCAPSGPHGLRHL